VPAANIQKRGLKMHAKLAKAAGKANAAEVVTVLPPTRMETLAALPDGYTTR